MTFTIPAPTVSTAPTATVLTLSDAKQHLRLDHTNEDDTYVYDLIKVAGEYIRTRTELTLITTTYQIVLCEFPDEDEIVLAYPPVATIDSVSYQDADDATQAFTDFTLQNDAYSRSRLVLDPLSSWPPTYERTDAVTITYTAGLSSTAAGLPASVRHCARLLVDHLYNNRGGVITGSISKSMEHSIDSLIGSLKTGRF